MKPLLKIFAWCVLAIMLGSVLVAVAFSFFGVGVWFYTKFQGAMSSFSSGGAAMVIPAEYAAVFNAAGQKYQVQPNFIAAIFYAGEHQNSWPPNINGPWQTSPPPSNAKGPFQFTDTTWNAHKQFARPNSQNATGEPDVQNIWDASFAAAHMLSALGAKNSTTDLNKLRDVTSFYNSGLDWSAAQRCQTKKCVEETIPYVNRVINAFLSFSQIANAQTLACTDYDGLNKTYGIPGQITNDQLTNVNFMGKNIQFHKIATPALQAVVNDIKSSGTNYQFRRIGGYNDKSITGQPDKKSMHAYGIAIDINDDTNPYQPNVTQANASQMKYDLPQAVINVFKRNGFRWGGDYRSLKDPMHFEYCK